MTGLPVMLGMVLFWLDPEGMHPLISTPLGYFVLAGVAISLSLGFMLIRKITTIDV